MNNQIIYLISGLGADRRMFERLSLPNFRLKHIEWIIPKPQESMEAYAKRLVEQIIDENPILVGLSFGGIMAMEIAKQIPTKKIILLASAKTKYEIPFYYRWLGMLRLNKIAPTSLLMQVIPITYWFFGIKNQEEKELLRAVIKDSNKEIYAWAIDKILNWENTTLHPNLKHIHGGGDRILPLRFIKADKIIKKGGHLMTLNQAEEISKEIIDFLQ